MDARENSKKKQLAPPKLKLLFTIVNREKTELFTALIQGFDVNMQLSAAARGTATQEIMQMLGLSDKSKSVIMSVIREDTEDTLLRFLDEKFHTIKNGKGIAFTVSMSSVIGVAVYRFLSNNNEGRMKMSIITNCQAIMCVVNSGFGDAVMDVAKEFGARGGTVIHARGTANSEAEKLFGITIQPEKEIVIILVRNEIRDSIMHAVYKKVGLDTEGQGIAFSIPVDKVIGIAHTKDKKD